MAVEGAGGGSGSGDRGSAGDRESVADSGSVADSESVGGAGSVGGGVDWRVALQGALLTLAVALPPAVLVRILKGDDLEGSESNLWVITVVAIFLGFALGGNLAARRRPRTALSHAAAASGLAFAGLGVYSLVRRVLTGDGLSGQLAIQLLLVGTITVSIGILGGYVATRRRPKGPAAP